MLTDSPLPAADADATAPATRDDGLPLAPALLIRALALRDWLLEEGSHDEKQSSLLSGLGGKLAELGIPVDRITTAIDALHSEYSGIGRVWTREEGSSFRLFPHGAEANDIYKRSPFAYVHRTREWLLLDLAQPSPEPFGVVGELVEAGYKHYLCVPISFAHGSQNGITFTTRSRFGEEHLRILRFVMPSIAAAMEVRAVNQRLDNVLRIYVGDEPHKAILSGTIQRGQVSRIRSAILFADMRGYTQMSSALPPEGAVELLNGFFDCLVPPIEAEGGEILKYMGDGLLAIFRDRGDDTGSSAQAGLNAAISALVHLDEANREGRFASKVEAGIALHHGEAAYGNVGSGVRLDFTVIGRDVNLASRMATMNRKLGEPLLMSQAFANHLWGDPEMIGSHTLHGFDEPVPLFRLRLTGKAEAELAGRKDAPPLEPDAARLSA